MITWCYDEGVCPDSHALEQSSSFTADPSKACVESGVFSRSARASWKVELRDGGMEVTELEHSATPKIEGNTVDSPAGLLPGR
jgi:hypothetical protein